MSEAVATPSAPASTPAAAPTPSAPATSGAPSAATSSRRPSFAEAFAANPIGAPASPASTPAAQESQTATPADATVPPVTDPNAPATPAPKPPVPYERFYETNEGKKAAEARLKELEARYGSPEFKQFETLAGLYNTDFREFRRQVDREYIARHPEAADEIASEAARHLASRRKSQQPQADSFEPDIPVYNETGQMVAQTFSADKVKAIVQHAVSEALQKEVGPIKQDFQTRKEQQEFARVQQEATKTANSQFDEAKQWPGFLVDPAKGTVDPDVVKAFNEHPEWSLERCYITTVVPKLRAKDQAQVLDDLKTKAAASSGVNPASSVTTTRRPKDFNDPSLRWS